MTASSNVRSGERRTRGTRAAAAPSPVATPAPGTGEPVVYTARGFWLAVAVAAVAAWWIVLFGTAFVAANPLTLNRAQLVQATHVVTATVLDRESGRVRFDRSFKGKVPSEFVVVNLAETAARTGETYLLPLVREPRGDFAVHRALLPGAEEDERNRPVRRRGPPLVYPATDEVLSQLDDLP